jgi:UDP-N-acetylglucosamine acyltransferase
VIGPYAVIEGKVHLGPGCIVRPYVHLCGDLTVGRNNQIFSGAVLGEQPQHLHYHGEPTRVEIGDGNVFREGVTVHRGTAETGATKIGNNNYLMANSHVGHDCRVGNNCIFANGTLLGGHCVIEDNVFLSGNTAVHQHCRVGRLAFLSGVSATSTDLPPFMIMQHINIIMGVNVIGMRRAGMTSTQVKAIRRAYHILYLSGKSIPVALVDIEREVGDVDAANELVTFIRRSKRGICTPNHREHGEAA